MFVCCCVCYVFVCVIGIDVFLLRGVVLYACAFCCVVCVRCVCVLVSALCAFVLFVCDVCVCVFRFVCVV